ncbi:unnamed protein product [Mesocestoides corti]|uniref:Uncharacterized protein n=1 Tax=Mesocestoides corti TaxID=53468 RepID=A0A0R3UEZ9_MESCO|nr:unnamed protein product [Mesocestoides corti]
MRPFLSNSLENGYELFESIRLRRLANPRFAQSVLPYYSSSPGESPSGPPAAEAPLFFTNNKLFVYDGRVRLLLGTSGFVRRASLSLFSSVENPRFTAVAKADHLYFVPYTFSLIYVAAGDRFSLLSLQTQRRVDEHIVFGDSSGAACDVTHMQALLSPSGDRSGLLVGRRNGLVELWDDRWPRKPAVTYHGSDAGLVTPSASPVPPKPVVDVPSRTIVASPLIGCPKIGVWQLKTGKLLNLLEYPVDEFDDPAFAPPPLLLLRSQWGWKRNRPPLRGPTLLSIGLRCADFFY